MSKSDSHKGNWNRIIIHADMDAFYAAIEQLDDPNLRDLPVIVGGSVNRGVVTTASYEARPFGVGSAMPMAEAMRRCPDALVVPPRFDRYSEVSKQVMETFESFSPIVEPLSLDEAFLDMTGSESLFGTPEQMATLLKKAVKQATGGLTVSVGVATTKFVAKVASDHQKPDGLTIVEPDKIFDFLWPLPVERLWGVGPKAQKSLAKLGLFSVHDIAHADPTWLRKHLGSLGDHIYRLSRANDPRPVVSQRRRKSVGAERTLESDIRGRKKVETHLRKVVRIVGRRLRESSFEAKGVRVKIKTSNFRLLTRQTTLPRFTNSTKTILEEAFSLLDQFDLDQPMRLIGVAAFDLKKPKSKVQYELFVDEDEQKRVKLDKTLDELKKRFGENVVGLGDEFE